MVGWELFESRAEWGEGRMKKGEIYWIFNFVLTPSVPK
jgi:hypothetical protein